MSSHNTSSIISITSSPDDEILAMSKLKGFADEKLNGSQNIKFVFYLIENIVEIGENAVFYSHNVFKWPLPTGVNSNQSQSHDIEWSFLMY